MSGPEALLACVGTVAGVGWIPLVVWLENRKKTQERQLAHAERMKALEMGHPLPDAEVARASVESSRAWAAGLVGFLVPIVLAAMSLGATAVVLSRANPMFHVAMIAIIWGISGVVSLVAVVTSLGTIRRQEKAKEESATPANPSSSRDLVTHIREEGSERWR